jgi:hypothetical protein
MAREELEGSPASRLGDIANEVVVCLEVPADALGAAGLGPLDGMPALPVARADGGPEIVAHFARNPWEAESDPDGSVHAAGLVVNLGWLAERGVPFDVFVLCIGDAAGVVIAYHRIAHAPGMDAIWHGVSHGGRSWVAGAGVGPAVPAEVAGAFGRSYDGPPGWRSPASYLR